ncbi:MAG TPA: DUF4124 domain-containing protein [Gammaproteobacteria bacterium]
MRELRVLILIALTAGASAAEIYRYVDADGNVVYSDKPLGSNVETLIIDTSTPTPPPAAAQPQPATAQAAEPEQDPGPTAEEIETQRAENCQIARDRLERYNAARRIYRGTIEEREYLTDEELVAIRAQAAADVDEWCG